MLGFVPGGFRFLSPHFVSNRIKFFFSTSLVFQISFLDAAVAVFLYTVLGVKNDSLHVVTNQPTTFKLIAVEISMSSIISLPFLFSPSLSSAVLCCVVLCS